MYEPKRASGRQRTAAKTPVMPLNQEPGDVSIAVQELLDAIGAEGALKDPKARAQAAIASRLAQALDHGPAMAAAAIARQLSAALDALPRVKADSPLERIIAQREQRLARLGAGSVG